MSCEACWELGQQCHGCEIKEKSKKLEESADDPNPQEDSCDHFK
jgi:hypothetical protein